MLFGIIDIAKEPFKGIYIRCSYLSLVLLRKPWWRIRYLLPAWRPRRTWSIRRCVEVCLARYYEALESKVGAIDRWPDHQKLELGDGVDGLYVDGVPDLITGKVKEWAASAGVSAVRIPGYWQYKSKTDATKGEKPVPGEKVVYFLHGGGYFSLSAHPHSPTSGIARAVMKQCPALTRSFAIEYRLSSWDPHPRANPFPAALIDALAGYNYLVRTAGHAPSDVVVVGDSAGGNLAVALTRYLIEHAGALDGLPAPPGALLLLSPWADLSGSHDTLGSSVYALAPSDFLLPPRGFDLDYDRLAFVGTHGEAFAANAYVSPACKRLGPAEVSFRGFPKTFLVAGDAEIFLDQIRTLRDRMAADMGEERFVYLESKDAFHDFIAFPFFEPQRQEALSAIGAWIEKL